MHIDMRAIQRVLSDYPSAELTVMPTPVYKLRRLSARIGQNVYVMREDLTGFAIGGNKVRKLDYLIGDAIKQRTDTLITVKASNFSRNAAAAGRVFGFDVHVLLAGKEAGQNPASQALFKEFGTHLYYIDSEDQGAVFAESAKLATELKNQGRRIYELHPGGSDEIGSLGYLNAFDEIVRYSQSTGVRFSKIIHSTGSTATQVGLLLGQHISAYETTIIGMAASQRAGVQTERIRKLAVAAADMIQIEFDESTIVVEDGFIGPGYAIPSPEGNDAIEIFAATEGILLDDVYTGKAAAGLIQYATDNKFAEDDNILFIHTGGNAGQYY